MRSGRLVSKNDELIRQLIHDELYDIRDDGTILTLVTISGKVSVNDTWRQGGRVVQGGKYRNINYKGHRLQIHRIIYQKYLGELQEDLVINHKDGNTTNNNPLNLELVTQSDNNTHRFRVLKHKPTGYSKINLEIANQIREDKKTGMTHKQLTEKYSLSKANISDIVNNKIWKVPPLVRGDLIC